jgi:hypothetical protein
MPNEVDPLVGVLHPPELDVGDLRERTSSGECPLEIRILGYADTARVRQDKAAGVAASKLRPREPSPAPAQREDPP